jgi:multidrug resistance efflux pump
MKLIPSEIIVNGIDTYLSRHNAKSRCIYLIVLVAITGIIISLPYIYIDVSVNDTGIIRPVGEKTEIKSTVSEYIDSVYIREGSRVRKGDTILRLHTLTPNYKINYQSSRLSDIQEHISDLYRLAKGESPEIFKSGTRRQEYLYFIKQKEEMETVVDKTQKDYERNKSLFEKDIIAAEEYETYLYEYTKAKKQLESFKDSQFSKWQTDLNSYTNMQDDVASALSLNLREKEFYVITSPVNGTIEQFQGIYKGSNIQAGSTIAVISPDSSLYAEVYVSPRNIGYIQSGMPVNLQVESFNYNEWGMIIGEVFEISADFLTSETNSPFYKVKCSLNNNFLQHKKGMKGFIKKGMTVSAHFMITRRSILDLLYLKMDNWINPTQYYQATNT